jgi:hypothetical protein
MTNDVKCNGASPDNTHHCAYRETCYRYTSRAGYMQVFSDFWLTKSDECEYYISKVERE